MRYLMWCAIGFAGACAVSAYLLSGNILLVIGCICLIISIALFFLKAKVPKIAAVILTGCAAGCVFNWCYQYFYLQAAIDLDDQKKTATVVAADYSYETNLGTAVDGYIQLHGNRYKAKAYLYNELQLKPGDQIEDEFTFRYTSVGTDKDPTYHQGKGIYLLAYGTEDQRVTTSKEEAFLDFPVRLRHRISQEIDRLFDADVAGFAKALLIGDSSDMSYENSTAFSVSGISHIIAVSGLHVSILCAVIQWLCFRKRRLSAIIGIPILLLFATVAGFTPSVVRACIMQAMVMISAAVEKEYDPATGLSVAVMLILLLNPLSITAVGFQLSVACMIGIYVFSGRIHKYLSSGKLSNAVKGRGFFPRILRMMIKSVSVSFSVWIVTAPLCAIHFGMVSVVGILTNLLTVWMVSFIFCGIILALVASFAWSWLGSFVAFFVAWPMRLVQFVAEILSKIPYAAVYTSSPYILCWLILCYVLLALFLIFRNRNPALLLSCMLIGLVTACVCGIIEEGRVQQRISILDVGQGQCIVLKCNDRYYMVDCGGSYDYDTADLASQYLQSKGIRQLDGLIISHYDSDHAGAAEMLMSRIYVKTLYLPDIQPDDNIRQALERKYTERICWIRNDIQIPEAKLTLFYDDLQSENESSICVLFQPDNYDILIMGDRNETGERKLMEGRLLPELEILVAGNHGSKYATGLGLLIQTKPAAVVISAGEDNYIHPSVEVLERLERLDCRVYRTDTMGTLEFGR